MRPAPRRAIPTLLSLVLLAGPLAVGAQTPAPAGSAKAGEIEFQTQCAMCHASDGGGFGPSLTGVVGRKAGAASGFAYSPALKAANFVWDPARLDRFVASPQGEVPGATMPFSLDDAKMRADIIAYLGTLK